MAKVSICIPAYEQIEFLKQTLDSITIQDFQDYEVIITDDSKSKDVENLAKRYDFKGRLKYYRNDQSLGSPSNWNMAVSKSTGAYIKLLHHDDYFSFPESLSSFVEILDKDPTIDFAFSSSAVKDATTLSTRIHHPSEYHRNNVLKNPYYLFFGNIIGAPSATIYRRKYRLDYDVNLKWLVDFEFYIRYLKNNLNFGFIEKPLITTYVNASHNVTNICLDNKQVELFEYLYLFNKIGPGKLEDRQVFNFFRTLFSRLNVLSVSELRESGYKKSIPLFMILLILLRKIKNFQF